MTRLTPNHCLPPFFNRWRIVSSLLAAALPFAAQAEGGKDLQLSANVAVTHDSNLFRLSRNANAQSIIGQSSPAETTTVSTLALNYEKAYSLQRVDINVSFRKFDYQNFDYLNANTLNYRAAWEWSYTPHFHGTISTSRAQALNSFLDSQSFRRRNERIDRTTRLDAVYELDARWRLIGGIASNARHNELPIVQEADYDNRAYDVGLRYALPSGSSASYTLRQTDGDLINRILPSPGLSDRAYDQTDHIVQAYWAVSDKTSVNFRLGHRSRTHPTYPQRNFDGLLGGVSMNWSYSPQTSFFVDVSSEIDSYQSANTNYKRTNRLSLGPTWRLGTKTSLSAQLGHEVLQYEGSPGLQPPSTRRESITNASINLGWNPFRYLSFNASLQNARRSANLPGLDFDANIVSLSARFTF